MVTRVLATVALSAAVACGVGAAAADARPVAAHASVSVNRAAVQAHHAAPASRYAPNDWWM